mgnify:CR=1 FL=1
MYKARFTARDLRRLCPWCHLRPGLHADGLCNSCALQAEFLRLVAQTDQAEATAQHLIAFEEEP